MMDGNGASKVNDRAVPATAHRHVGSGHNLPPSVRPFGIDAPWLHFARLLELTRLATLHVRIQRRQRAIDEMIKERRKIMMRCIRRMRRAGGRE